MSLVCKIKSHCPKNFFPLFFLFWLGLVGVNYFGRYSTYYLVLKIKEIILFLVVIFFIWAMGRRLFRLTKLNFSPSLETNIFAFGLGLGFWGYFMFFLGILGGLYSKVILSFFIVISLCCFKEMKDIVKVIKSIYFHKFFSFSLWGVILGFAFFLSFLGALGPAVSTDALRYHLSIPNLYLLNHKIFPLSNNLFSNFPASMDMLYLFCLSLGSQSLAKMVHCLVGILSALTIYSLGKKYFNFEIGVIAANLFFTTPFVLLLSSVAFIDLGVVFFFFLSVYALLNYDREKKINYLLVSAIFAGLAIGTKYSGGLFIFVLGLLFFYKRAIIDKARFYFAIKELVLFYSVVLIIVSPWLLRNFFYTKNPFYPFLEAGNHLYMKILCMTGIRINTLNWLWLPLIAPWHITLYVTHFENWRLGMVYLTFLPFLFLLKKIDTRIKYFGCYCLIIYLIWVYSIQNVRFLLPVFPILCIIIAYIVSKVISFVRTPQRERKLGSKGFEVFIKSTLVFIFLWNILDFMMRSPYFISQLYLTFGRISRTDYLRKELPFYDIFQYINHHLPVSAKILFLGQYREGGYLKRNYLYSSEFEKPILFSLLDLVNRPEGLLEKLKLLGITHLLFNKEKLNRVSFGNYSLNLLGGKKNIFNVFWNKYLENVCQENGIILYKIKYEPR